MTPRSPSAARHGGCDAFVVGPNRSGTALLYRLLCLHPEVAYVSTLERRVPWLPAAVSGRVRLRRYASKLRYWFRDDPMDAAGGRGALLDRLIPLPAETAALDDCADLRGLAAGHCLDARDMVRMRTRFADLRRAVGARVMVSRLGPARRKLPLIDAVFPQARYLSVVRDGRDVAASLARLEAWTGIPLWWDTAARTPAEAVAQGEDLLHVCARNWLVESEEISRGLARIPPARVMQLHFEDLVAAPVEQMRAVVEFLGLERRMDYEWALKTLKLADAGGRRTAPEPTRARLETLFSENGLHTTAGFAPVPSEIAS